MQHRWSKSIRYSLIVGVLLFCGVTLSGCDVLDFLGNIFRISNGNEARADSHQFVRTLRIAADTFRIEFDNPLTETSVEITEGVTIYRGGSGRVFFTLQGGSQQNTIVLATEDIVIERPGSGFLTLITVEQISIGTP